MKRVELVGLSFAESEFVSWRSKIVFAVDVESQHQVKGRCHDSTLNSESAIGITTRMIA